MQFMIIIIGKITIEIQITVFEQTTLILPFLV